MIVNGDMIYEKASAVIGLLKTESKTLATAESCTGGMVAASITDIPGASEVFESGFITYSNRSKIELLGVDKTIIEQYGAVSREAAMAMAEGTVKKSSCDISIAVTGIAGPGGGDFNKPVGLVYISVADCDKHVVVRKCEFQGDRKEIRIQSVQAALDLLFNFVHE